MTKVWGLILAAGLGVGIATEAPAKATHKFHKAGGCYKIEYAKYKKIEGHKAFAISRFYERGRRWSQACGWAFASTEEEAIERAIAECRIGATREGGKEQAMKIPKPNCQVYHSE